MEESKISYVYHLISFYLLMRTFSSSLILCTLLASPLSALALEGIGPRVTVTGTVVEVRISEKQAFEAEGGEFVIKATNGQLVTLIVTEDTQIISEGRLSRKNMTPVNIVKDMQVRVRGWRIDSKTLTASLFIIMNVELNPALSLNGTIQSIDDTTITILATDGRTGTYNITNETEVNISYILRGKDGLTLVGKQTLLTLNPNDRTQVRVLRITGNAAAVQTTKPSTVDLGRRSQD